MSKLRFFGPASSVVSSLGSKQHVGGVVQKRDVRCINFNRCFLTTLRRTIGVLLNNCDEDNLSYSKLSSDITFPKTYIKLSLATTFLSRSLDSHAGKIKHVGNTQSRFFTTAQSNLLNHNLDEMLVRSSTYPTTAEASKFPNSKDPHDKNNNNIKDYNEKPDYNYPCYNTCAKMPRAYHEIPNEALLLMAAGGDHSARRERLVREIIFVDEISYVDALNKVRMISKTPDEDLLIRFGKLPYKTGMCVSILCGYLAIPATFHLPTAMWFNDRFVTCKLPDIDELDTILEVGSWTWNWMEPVMGTLSFFLLCMQFARTQMSNLFVYRYGPYATFLKRRRINRLHASYPQYSPLILDDFSDSLLANPEESSRVVLALNRDLGKTYYATTMVNTI